MSKVCADCKGKGRWQDEVHSGSLVEIVSRYCSTCTGTGQIAELNELEDFDIDSSSFEDEL